MEANIKRSDVVDLVSILPQSIVSAAVRVIHRPIRVIPY